MKSYARNQGSQVANTVLKDDIQANDTDTLSEDTIAKYINALKKIFVIEDMPAQNPNLRSKTAINLRNGKYGLAEIKLGGQKLIEEGAKNSKLY